MSNITRHEGAKLIITDNIHIHHAVATDKQLAKRRTLSAIQYLRQQGIAKWRINTAPADQQFDQQPGEQKRQTKPATQQYNLIVERAGLNSLKLTMVRQAAFAHGSAQLTPQGRALMQQLTSMLKPPRPDSSRLFETTGHCRRARGQQRYGKSSLRSDSQHKRTGSIAKGGNNNRSAPCYLTNKSALINMVFVFKC